MELQLLQNHRDPLPTTEVSQSQRDTRFCRSSFTGTRPPFRHLWLLLCYDSKVGVTETHSPESLKYLPSGPLKKRCADPCPSHGLQGQERQVTEYSHEGSQDCDKKNTFPPCVCGVAFLEF